NRSGEEGICRGSSAEIQLHLRNRRGLDRWLESSLRHQNDFIEDLQTITVALGWVVPKPALPHARKTNTRVLERRFEKAGPMVRIRFPPAGSHTNPDLYASSPVPGMRIPSRSAYKPRKWWLSSSTAIRS